MSLLLVSEKTQHENLAVQNGFIEQAHLYMLTVDSTKYNAKMETTKLNTWRKET